MPYNDLLKGRASIPGMQYLVTSVCHRRQPVFRSSTRAHRLTSELHSLEENGVVEWLAWVIMPDHFHGLLSLTGGHSLSRAMQQLKGRSARVIGGQLWQKGFHDHALRNDESRQDAARYLLANPLRAGLVTSLRDYPFWYCRWLKEGEAPDEFLHPP